MVDTPRRRPEPGEGWEPSLREWRTLVPIFRAQTATPLLAVAGALSAPAGAGGVVLGLVELPPRRLPHLNRVVERRRLDLLRWLATVDTDERQVGLTVQMRVSHDVPLGVREAVYENDSNLIVVEWPGVSTRRPKLLGAVLEELTSNPPADLALVRPALAPKPDGRPPANILVPIRGGPNARLAMRVADTIAESAGAHLTFLHVIDGSDHPRRRRALADSFQRMVGQVRHRDVEVLVRAAQRGDPGAAILRESRGFDMVVMGAFAEPQLPPVLVRSELATMVRRLSGTVILTRTAG
ncbi:MAG: universal stress protein [Candidatus Dormibacteraeota bacterium]|nr:universal stress protein [Candidatus Dormibacteraeota bacterium]